MEVQDKRRRPRALFHAPKVSEAVLTMLLEFTPNPEVQLNIENLYGETPLALVAKCPGDQVAKVMIMLNKGARVTQGMIESAVHAKNYKVMRALHRGFQVKGDSLLGPSPLEMAILEGGSQLVKEVISWKET